MKAYPEFSEEFSAHFSRAGRYIEVMICLHLQCWLWFEGRRFCTRVWSNFTTLTLPSIYIYFTLNQIINYNSGASSTTNKPLKDAKNLYCTILQNLTYLYEIYITIIFAVNLKL